MGAAMRISSKAAISSVMVGSWAFRAWVIMVRMFTTFLASSWPALVFMEER